MHRYDALPLATICTTSRQTMRGWHSSNTDVALARRLFSLFTLLSIEGGRSWSLWHFQFSTAPSLFALLKSVVSGCVCAFGLLRRFFVRAIGDCANGGRSRDGRRRASPAVCAMVTGRMCSRYQKCIKESCIGGQDSFLSIRFWKCKIVACAR